MTGMPTAGRLDAWERRMDLVIRFVPYVALAVSTVLAWVAAPHLPGPPLAGTLALAGVAAVWMLWMVTLHPDWADRRVLMAVYFVGLVALITALIARSPLFGFFAFAGYLHAVYALRGTWRLVGVAAIAVLSSVSQVGGFATLRSGPGLAVFAVIVVFNIGLAAAMTFLGWVTTEQAERRKVMIVELAEANSKLEAAMAENAGLHAQLLAQAREAGVLDERQRMAGEIHDTLAQGLIGIVTQLEAADQAALASPPDRAGPGSPSGPDGEPVVDWRRHVRTAARLARDSLTEARRSVQALRPQPLDNAPLPQALTEVVDGWSTMSGVPAELVTTGTVQRLLPEIEMTLLRTAQEALANVAKHASASRVTLTLSYMEDMVSLDVRDDGVGFDPSVARTDRPDGGYGLTVMGERVRRIAGTLEVESEAGVGTAISACVPAVLAGGRR
ncbi:MAG TPA: sensor histidine kinase [Pilimelia sp.]|nr:sensor histidine kinase [Pilimelia sp.]